METYSHNPSPLAGEGARLGGLPPSRSGRGQVQRKKLLLERARYMRSNPTEAEAKLWQILRCKRLAGFKFKRQVLLDDYIADFVNFERRVIVEADGSQHLESEYDAKRDAYLSSQGFALIRFWNSDILRDGQSVEDAIWHALQEAPLPPTAARRAPPSPARGEGSIRSNANNV